MRAVIDEIVGLFVDDGFLAAALVLWCGAVGLLAATVPGIAGVGGPVLSVGCAVILLATVMRASRRR